MGCAAKEALAAHRAAHRAARTSCRARRARAHLLPLLGGGYGCMRPQGWHTQLSGAARSPDRSRLVLVRVSPIQGRWRNVLARQQVRSNTKGIARGEAQRLCPPCCAALRVLSGEPAAAVMSCRCLPSPTHTREMDAC